MSALVPRYRKSFPYTQFPLYKSGHFGTYDLSWFQRRRRRPGYWKKPFNPLAFNGLENNKSIGFPNLTLDWNIRPNGFGKRFLRHTRRKELRNWKSVLDTMVAPLFSTLPLTNFNRGQASTIYQLEREIRYVPYPVLSGPMGTDPLELNAVSNLSPKIRVIFIPQTFSSLPPLSTGPLTMPPFLLDRVSRNWSSFALPPPLPQISSLPLTPAVQKIIMDRYTNRFPLPPALSNYTFNPSNMPISALQDATPPASNPPHESHSTICRACPPPPPSLNMAVANHHWLQHCSACRATPNSFAHSNSQTNRGRITPLLGRSIATRAIPDPSAKHDKYPHVNTTSVIIPWQHAIPPLPQGAIVITDEYIVQDTEQQRLSFPSDHFHQRPKPRRFRSRRQRQINSGSSDESSEPAILQEINSESTFSSPISASREMIEFQKRIDRSIVNNLNAAPHCLNLYYNYPPKDLSSVYHRNRRLTSESQMSLASSKVDLSKEVPTILIIKEYKRRRVPPAPLSLERSSHNFSPISIRSRKSITIREVTSKSPSTSFSNSEVLIVLHDSPKPETISFDDV